MAALRPYEGPVEKLAEELAAMLAADRSPATARLIDHRIAEEAERRHCTPWGLTLAVARAWDRLGIVRTPAQAGPMGDGWR